VIRPAKLQARAHKHLTSRHGRIFHGESAFASLSSASRSYVYDGTWHILYPATITFSATNSATGRLRFNIDISGDYASNAMWLKFEAGGKNLTKSSGIIS